MHSSDMCGFRQLIRVSNHKQKLKSRHELLIDQRALFEKLVILRVLVNKLSQGYKLFIFYLFNALFKSCC